MADILKTPSFNYTYPGQVTTDVFIKPILDTPDINRIFTVQPMIKSKKQLTLIGNLTNIVKKWDDANCGLGTATDGIAPTNRTLEVEPMQVYLNQCASAFRDTVMEELLKSGVDENDFTDGEINSIINQVIVEGARRDHFRLFSFGDKNAALNANYNFVDGLWTRIYNSTVTDYCVNKAAALGTGSLSAGAALTALRSVHEGAANLLKQAPAQEKKFFVTQSVYENYLTSLESTTSGSDQQFRLLEDGTMALQFRGIDVIPIVAWDEDLADSNNPWNGTLQHLILYTTPKNHIIGYDRTGDESSFKAWYSDDDDLTKFLLRYRMGYNYIHCDLTTVAY